MNQEDTAWPQKIILLRMAILTGVLGVPALSLRPRLLALRPIVVQLLPGQDPGAVEL